MPPPKRKIHGKNSGNIFKINGQHGCAVKKDLLSRKSKRCISSFEE